MSGEQQTQHEQVFGSSRGTMKALLLWVPLPFTVNTLDCPSLGTPTGSVTKPCSPGSKGMSQLSLSTKGVNYKTEQKMLHKGVHHTQCSTLESHNLSVTSRKKGRHQHCQVKLSGTGRENANNPNKIFIK